MTVHAKIRPDNVFTQCDCCDEEIPVNLAEVFADGESDLENAVLLCRACSKLLMEGVREM